MLFGRISIGYLSDPIGSNYRIDRPGKLNNEIWYLLNNYLTDSSQALLGGCKHRINQAVLECQSEINQISIDNQLKTSFEKLITVIEEALNTITGIINKLHVSEFEIWNVDNLVQSVCLERNC
jgi:hypothetical protein